MAVLVWLLSGLPVQAGPPVEPGFVSLFDGKDIEKHFTIKGKHESWRIVDGVIHSTPGGDRIMSKEVYRDFILRLDWKVSTDGNSGIFVRVPSADDGAPWITGFEVQITNAPRDDSHCTGSLYGVQAVKPRPDETANVWHSYEIVCLGGRITARVNGIACLDADASKIEGMRNRPLEGYIGLQDSHAGQGSTIDYRNIRIARLNPDGTAAGFKALATDDRGWHKIKTGHGSGGQWDFIDGAWIGQQDPPGSGNGGVLVTDQKLGDFEMILSTKPDWGVCSGIFLRSNDRGQCYQIMVDWHGGGNVGSIYGEGTGGFNSRNYNLNDDKSIVVVTDRKDVLPLPFTAAEWTRHWRFGQYNEIRCRVVDNPPIIDVWLNGTYITHFKDDQKRLDDAGHVGIQVHGGKGWPNGAKVRFRGVQVKSLKKG
jgi:hypothetical protein